jgi:hypothetical protein
MVKHYAEIFCARPYIYNKLLLRRTLVRHSYIEQGDGVLVSFIGGANKSECSKRTSE